MQICFNVLNDVISCSWKKTKKQTLNKHKRALMPAPVWFPEAVTLIGEYIHPDCCRGMFFKHHIHFDWSDLFANHAMLFFVSKCHPVASKALLVNVSHSHKKNKKKTLVSVHFNLFVSDFMRYFILHCCRCSSAAYGWSIDKQLSVHSFQIHLSPNFLKSKSTLCCYFLEFPKAISSMDAVPSY